MTVHYHGLPLTPHELLFDLAGNNVCISYATQRPAQTEACLAIMQQILFDNGAFSIHQQGGALNENSFYSWLDPMLGLPHWAVVPDVIGGDVDAQRKLARTWPFPRELGAPVWHLNLPIDYLLELADTWPRLCFGSSKEYWQIGTPIWWRRMHEAFNALAKRQTSTWVHGLRMMAVAGKLPLASVDSVNVARNYKRQQVMPGAMALRLNRANGPTRVNLRRQGVFV